MKTIYFYIITILTLALSGCGNPYEKEIKEVEEMQVVLTSVKASYETIELEKVVYAKDSYTKNMNQIQAYYKPDSMDMNVVQLLDLYKGVKKSAKGFEDDYHMLGEKIEFIDHQLVTLKNDLENNIDLKDSIDIFLSNERKNIEVLQKNIGTIIYNYDYVTKVHDSISNKVQAILIQNVE
jgi:hypothetical protein